VKLIHTDHRHCITSSLAPVEYCMSDSELCRILLRPHKTTDTMTGP